MSPCPYFKSSVKVKLRIRLDIYCLVFPQPTRSKWLLHSRSLFGWHRSCQLKIVVVVASSNFLKVFHIIKQPKKINKPFKELIFLLSQLTSVSVSSELFSRFVLHECNSTYWAGYVGRFLTYTCLLSSDWLFYFIFYFYFSFFWLHCQKKSDLFKLINDVDCVKVP